MKSLLFAIVLSGGMVLGQTPSITPDSQPVDKTAAPDQATVKPQTVRGCLHSAGDNYTVIDQVSGKTFKLEGSTDRLKQFIGQTVEITGSVKSVDGESKPASASTGDILTLADVKQVSDKCSAVPNSGALAQPQVVLLALMQRPVNDDANTQLNSSAQMSSNATETSAAAASTRSITTSNQQHGVVEVGGHTGVHGLSVNTSDTKTVGESTAPTSSAGGFAATRNPNDLGKAPIDPQAYNKANQRSENERDKNAVPNYLNAEGIGSSMEDGNRAAEAASRAEMQTDANGQKTTWSTARPSEANASGNPNPKINNAPNPNVKQETNSANPNGNAKPKK
jgi:hypothetical protein